MNALVDLEPAPPAAPNHKPNHNPAGITEDAVSQAEELRGELDRHTAQAEVALASAEVRVPGQELCHAALAMYGCTAARDATSSRAYADMCTRYVTGADISAGGQKPKSHAGTMVCVSSWKCGLCIVAFRGSASFCMVLSVGWHAQLRGIGP